MDAYTFGALIGSLVAGALIGAIPAICGAVKQKMGLAIGGFFACLVSGLIRKASNADFLLRTYI